MLADWGLGFNNQQMGDFDDQAMTGGAFNSHFQTGMRGILTPLIIRAPS
jgi:hypothetical protein